MPIKTHYSTHTLIGEHVKKTIIMLIRITHSQKSFEVKINVYNKKFINTTTIFTLTLL